MRVWRMCSAMLMLCAAGGSAAEPPVREEALLATYGPGAAPAQGDEDARQELYFRLPRDSEGELFLRLFDADCGGALDDVAGVLDTTTRFRLVGRNELARLELGADPLHDGRWSTVARFTAADGEEDGESALFRLEVEGIAGDDANLFNVALSREDKENVPPPGLEVFSYEPTLRLPRPGARAELQFLVPGDAAEVEVRGFDLGGAHLSMDTASRSGIPLASSGQGEWAESSVVLLPEERGRRAALALEGGRETPNDATFQVRQGERLLEIALPAWVRPANRRPVPQATALALADCRTVVFDASASRDPDGDALELSWDFGDGGRGRGRRTRHTYAAPGTYAARLSVEDDSGQVTAGAAVDFTVVVNVPPRAAAGGDRVAAPGEAVAFDGSASEDDDGEIVAYLWDLGDGTRLTGPTVSHAYLGSGRYRVVLGVEDDTEGPCNSDSDELEVWVNSAPAVDAGPDRRGAVGEPLAFEPAGTADGDGEIAAYLWDLGDGAVEPGPRVEHAYAAPGSYRVTLAVTDDAGAANSTARDQLTVRVNDPPVPVAAAPPRAAAGEPLTFDGGASRDPDGEIVAYRWDFGDGAAAEGARAVHTYDEPGRYQARLTVRDDSATSSDTASDTAEVAVNHPPLAEAGDDRVVTASEVRFDASSSRDPDGEIVVYRWDFGDGASSSEAAPVHVYRRPGSYLVELAVSDDSGTRSAESSDRLQVRVNAAPVADAGADRVAAPGEELTFDGSGSADPDGEVVAYRWDFGDGATAEGRRAVHAYAEGGTYGVELVVGDDTGQAAAVGYDQVTVRVNRPPVADAGPDVVAAPGDEVVLDGSRSYDPDDEALSFEWRTDDGDRPPAGEAVARYRFERPGTYRATLHVADGSGARNSDALDEAAIFVNHAPQARAGDDVFACAGAVWLDGSASVDPDGDPLACRWDFGDGTPVASGTRIRHAYAHGGRFPVVLTVDDGRGLANSTDTASLTVTLNEPPAAAAGPDREVCAGVPVLLSGSASSDPEGGLLLYAWDFGDGTAAEGIDPIKVYARGGTYAVTLTVRDDSGLPCDRATDTAVLSVAESPVAEAGADQTVCLRAPVSFDGSGSRDFVDGVVDRYFWDFGDGTTGGGATPVHAYEKPGEYRVVLTITGDPVGECGETGSDKLEVTVLEGPVARLAAPDAVVPGAPADFDAGESSSSQGEIVSWQWDFGDGGDLGGEASGPRVSHAFREPGRYRVRVTVATAAESCRTATAESWVTVNAPPAAVAGEDRLAAVSELLAFSAAPSEDPDGSLVAYDWDFGDGATASGVEVWHRYERSGRFPVTLEVRDDAGLANSRSRDTLEVTVNAAPRPVVTAPAAACADEEVAFDGTRSADEDGGIVAWAWDFGDGSQGEGAELTHTFRAPGRYEVSLTVDDGSGAANGRAVVTRPFTVNRPPLPASVPGRQVCPDDEVVLDGSASTDPDGAVAAYRWDLGDGTSASGARVTHAYRESGRYAVILEVEDDSATSCAVARASSSVLVNASPVARFDVPGGKLFAGGAHDEVAFDATTSSDPDGDPLTFHWDFGDGTVARGVRIRHSYLKPGTYTVALTVRDGSGLPCGEASAELTLEIASR